MEAKKILIGIPSNRQDSRFLASINNLIEQMQGKYQVTLLIEKWNSLPKAQNNIADYFLSRDFDYLLFLDDDHWGHTIDMVDILIEANSEMATIKTYVRHFPYTVALFKINDSNNFNARYSGIDYEDGYHQVDMTGFPMTLLRPQLFNKLEKPYFKGIDFAGRDWNTDIDFCERLNNIGIKPIGCYQYCLAHGDITKENVDELRKNNTLTLKDKLTMSFYCKKE